MTLPFEQHAAPIGTLAQRNALADRHHVLISKALRAHVERLGHGLQLSILQPDPARAHPATVTRALAAEEEVAFAYHPACDFMWASMSSINSEALA